MHDVATDQTFDAFDRRHDDGIHMRPGQSVAGVAPLALRCLGLETMASLLVVSLSRLGSRCYAGLCQWPRLHPLNDRAVTAGRMVTAPRDPGHPVLPAGPLVCPCWRSWRPDGRRFC